MKIRLLLFTFLCSVLSWGQTSLILDDFGTTTQNPLSRTGWATVAPSGSPIDLRLTGASTSYTWANPAVSFSGGANVFTNLGNGTATKTLTYDNSISTIGYTNIRIRFGGLKVATVPALDVSYSTDGATYISAGTVTLGTAWTAFTTNLPVGAENIANLRIRISVVANNSTANSIRLDDFHIIGTSLNTITTDTSLVGSPFCVNASTSASVSVPFTSVGAFTGANVYTAQLSNAAGSFAAPVAIGTLSSTANSGTILANIPAGTAAGTGYRIRVISNTPAVSGSNNTVNLNVQNSAAITTHPSTTVQNRCQGVAATAFTVSATGTAPPSYQWYSNTTATNSGGTAVGTNSTSYTPLTTTVGTLYYYCLVTAVCGASATSNVSGAVNVTAIPSAPSGTITPSANPSCGAATLSYSAPSATIYWQTTAGGTSTANNTLTNYTSSAAANTYTIYVRELSGTCWSPATSVTFTVNAAVNITAQPPISRLIADGANTTFTVTATGTTPTYQWQVDTGGGFVDLFNVAPHSTVTTATLNITAATLAMNGYLYRCIVTGTSPCGSVISNSGQLNIISPATNDLCASATTVVVNAASIAGTLSGTTFTAPFTKKDVWYSFTPTCSGTHDITVSGFTGDVDIELFSGSCPATTTTIDGSAGTTSTETISSALTAGTTYYLRVLAFNVAAETANFNVSVTSTSELLLTNIGSPATGNIAMGTASAVIMGFMTSPNCATSYSLSSVTLTKSVVSTATTADISNFRIIYDINLNGVVDGAETSISGAGIALGNTMAFTLTGQTLITVARRYLLVADVSATATNGRTIKVNITPNTDLIATVTPVGTKAGTALGNTQTIVPPTCTSVVIASVTPASGPVGTQVTVTASSGDLTSAVATFSGINATVVSSSTTQLVLLIPAGAVTGNLVITDSQPCNAVVAYTIINNDDTSCEGSTSGSFTDLIISEIYDTQAGNGMYLELFNPTASPITVNAASPTYRLGIDNDNGSGVLNGINRVINITGTVPAGGTIVYNLGSNTPSESPCTSIVTVDFFGAGVNERDAVYLLKNGTVIGNAIDVVMTPNETGFTLRRLPTAVGPTTTFNTADWTTLSAEECPDLGFAPVILGAPPTVSTQPTYSPACGATSATLTTLGVQGFAGGNGLVYTWYEAAPGSSTWSVVAIAGNFADTDSNSATLNIASITLLTNYQYYCQIRENTATCYKATNAVIIGSSTTSTWNGTIWVGGTPTITQPAIIDGTYVTATNGNFSCCSLTVNTGVGRSLTISSGGYVEIQNSVTNNGVLDILNNGSLVQINDAAVNTGNIFVKRTANIRLQDYSLWSSPISNAARAAVFPITSVSPSTPTSVIWKWGPTSPSGNAGQGMWLNTTENMLIGTGYAVRGPSGTSNSTTTPLNVNFSGVPNNGVFPVTISRGSDLNAGSAGPNLIMRTVSDDNWNLIGNPYPSAIDADLFIARYGVSTSPDFADIEGSVRVWSHSTLPSTSITDPFYANYQANYTAADYIVYNSLGSQSGPAFYNGKIPSGQAFFVLMLNGGMGTNTINFKNAIRDKTFDNSQFFKSGSSISDNNRGSIEKHRIWLDLISPSYAVSRTLFGYATGATNGIDNTFDAIADSKMSYNLYSIVNDEVFTNQGRALPFDKNDTVKIGLKTTIAGTHKIALSAVDGLFGSSINTQKIYLEDKELNVIHDLITPYEFYALQGTHENRFVVRYTNGVLATDTNASDSLDVIVVSNDNLSVQATNSKIVDVIVYDVLGRKLYEGKNVNTKNLTLPIAKHNVPLFLKITLENGIKLNKKVIY